MYSRRPGSSRRRLKAHLLRHPDPFCPTLILHEAPGLCVVGTLSRPCPRPRAGKHLLMKHNLLLVCLPVVLSLLSLAAVAQQEYVSRYDAFASFSYLTSPKLNLVERGFDGSFGVNLNRWLTLGGDYSIFTGHSDIFARDLTPALQLQLAAEVPPGVVVSLPFD